MVGVAGRQQPQRLQLAGCQPVRAGGRGGRIDGKLVSGSVSRPHHARVIPSFGRGSVLSSTICANACQST
jgi:hypothetical protein